MVSASRLNLETQLAKDRNSPNMNLLYPCEYSKVFPGQVPQGFRIQLHGYKYAQAQVCLVNTQRKSVFMDDKKK